MKILLINTNRHKDPVPVLPLGLCYIASAIEKAGYELKFLDLCFSIIPKNDIINTIVEYKPDIIGFSIRNLDTATGYKPHFFIKEIKNEMIDPCKKKFNGPIIIGGCAVGINGEEILKYFDLEYGIKGEGERTIVEFIKRFEKGKSLKGLNGLIIRDNKKNKIIQNNQPDFIGNLNKLSFPRPDKYLNLALYRFYDSPLQIQTKRGCKLKCSYCIYNKLEGPYYRLRDPKNVVDEIEELVKTTGIKNIEFVDSTFNMPLDHAKSILKEIISRKLKLKLSTMGLYPKGFDEEFVDLLKKSGFYDVCVTVESGSNPILKNLGKTYNKDDIYYAAKLLHKKHIPIQWFLLLGAPGETLETLKETFSLIKKAASIWDMIVTGVGIRIYKDTPISQDYLKKHPKCTDDNFFKPFPFIPESLDLKTIRLITKYYSYKQFNLFLYDKGAGIPFLFRVIFNFIFPRQPIWKGFIFLGLYFRIIGFLFVSKIIFKFIHKDIVKLLKNKDKK